MASEINFRQLRILVIDDQRPFLVMMKGILNSLGARNVLLAQSCEAALSIVSKQPFDLLFVDYDLGAAKKNGRQLLEELKQKKLLKPESIFVLVTGESHRPMVLSAVEQQPDDYLVKPFAQASLLLRLKKLFNKKDELKEIYAAMFKENWTLAVKECKNIVNSKSRHRHFCMMILVELYWKQSKFDDAEAVLTSIKEKNIPWARLAQAKNRFYQGKYDEAIAIARDVIKEHELFVEARDIIALSYYQKTQMDDAYKHIKLALDLSPYSLERQLNACKIGQEVEDFDFVKDCCYQIMEQSKKSIHQDIRHYCNYVRSLLDAAEHNDEKKAVNKLQQEAMLALQRAPKDEIAREGFDFSSFETLITARIESNSGRMLQAKKTAYQEQGKLKKNEAHKHILALDTMKVMLNIGEIEQAQALVTELQEEQENLDEFSTKQLHQSFAQIQKKSGSFIEENKKGIKNYTAGNYQQAIEYFKKALEFAPMNSGAILNLIQAALKLLEQAELPEDSILDTIKKSFKLVENIELPAAQQQRYENLKKEFEEYQE